MFILYCIYFVLSYRCFFKGFGLAKPYTHHQRETKLHCVHFVLWCSKLHHNVSLHLWHTIYIKMYELTYIRVASIHCHVTYHKSLLYCLDPLLIYLEHPDISFPKVDKQCYSCPMEQSKESLCFWLISVYLKGLIISNQVKVRCHLQFEDPRTNCASAVTVTVK